MTFTSLKGAARDIIQDFSRAEGDKIDLQEVDANASGAGNGTFIFQAARGAAFTGVTGQLHYSWIDAPVATNDKTIIEGDVNGDKVADFQIELTCLKTLVGSDFVLLMEASF